MLASFNVFTGLNVNETSTSVSRPEQSKYYKCLKELTV